MIRIYFWKIPRRYIPWALLHMGLDRIFTPRDADPRRWGLLVVLEQDQLETLETSPLIRRWRAKSIAEFSADLSPISVHGKWSKKEPFQSINGVDSNWNGKVAAITRARIKWRKNLIFWRSVPPVTQSLRSSPGLVSAIGIGEAPIGLQGTFSLWESGDAVRNFAYRGEAHKAAIAATHREDWYAEELFARFAVTRSNGDI